MSELQTTNGDQEKQVETLSFDKENSETPYKLTSM